MVGSEHYLVQGAMVLDQQTRLCQAHPLEDHGGGAEAGECTLDQVDPDKDTQPDEARVYPSGEQQREQQNAACDYSDSVIYCHLCSPFHFLEFANLEFIYTIEQISGIANLIL